MHKYLNKFLEKIIHFRNKCTHIANNVQNRCKIEIDVRLAEYISNYQHCAADDVTRRSRTCLIISQVKQILELRI